MKKIITILLLTVSTPFFAQCWQKVSAGNDFTIAIRDDGTLWSWGRNPYGQLGDGSPTTSISYWPKQTSEDNTWVTVSAGWNHAAGIKSDGTLWTWGQNYYGNLGDGTNTDKTVPVQVGSATNWVYVSANYDNTFAIKSDGTLWAWGQNSFYELGDGTNVSQNIPIQIGTATNWKMVTGGFAHTIGVKTNGTLWAWGRNNLGQLGDGTTVDKTIPTQITTATNWTEANAGYEHSAGLKLNGTVWGWGHNQHGEVGNGTQTLSVLVPTQAGTDTNWKSVKAGRDHNIATKTNGTLWSWGSNVTGQQGNLSLSTSTRTSPGQVDTATDWESFDTSVDFNFARKTNGAIYGWGSNTHAQLGNGYQGTNPDLGDAIICGASGCNPPTNLNTNNITATSAKIQWYQTAGAGYLYLYNTSNVLGGTDGAINDANIPSAILTGLLPDTTYYWWVASICSGDPVWIQGESFTTLALTAPLTAAPDPTLPQSSVISMYSNVYTNVPVDTWKTSWTPAQVGLTDLQIAGNDTKKYTNLNYVGIETVTNPLNVNGMTHLNMNVWSHNFTVFKVKLVDLGADGTFGGGDNVEHEITYTTPASAQWITYHIPLSAFTSLVTKGHIAQLILASSDANVYIDNVYFSNESAENQPASIAIVGDGVGGWPSGVPGEVDARQMSTSDHVHWTYDNLVVSAGRIKFRGNNSWTLPYNWGVNGPQNFTAGTATADGGDIISKVGVYDVTFNSTTGAYTFSIDQTAFPVLGMIGSATPGGDTDDTDMFTNDGVNYSYVGVQLVPGFFKFRHDHMWTTTNNWGGNTFPVGAALLDSDYINIPTAGNYDVFFSKGSPPFYTFSFAGISLVGAATPGGWPAGTPEEVDPHQLTTTDGIHYTLNGITLTEGPVKFRADNAWERQWGASTFPIGTAQIQIGGDIVISPAGTYDVAFNILTGAFEFTSTLSVVDLDTASLVVYPNPTNDSWNFKVANENMKSVQIMDITGKVIMSKSVTGNELKVNASKLSSGIYFAKVTTDTASKTVKLLRK
ncbi:MAG: hypothetical protein CFE23_08405 [Flavobacterium sp. BFFFF1]|uniref:T9SS type A sorting domain-containing protein n=1 Tax=Flavobacterium sp. BFFFF1 TaxID=2015557 RepID=UPI000BCC372E|nr:T9SS type A sorting domain-containing protein [Flavobacterium sp. BFFFF1]OYU80729.1 MAG: hypothetical protein CFE23_08405 [Flavobacterium sp. BFFFF1]